MKWGQAIACFFASAGVSPLCSTLTRARPHAAAGSPGFLVGPVAAAATSPSLRSGRFCRTPSARWYSPRGAGCGQAPPASDRTAPAGRESRRRTKARASCGKRRSRLPEGGEHPKTEERPRRTSDSGGVARRGRTRLPRSPVPSRPTVARPSSYCSAGRRRQATSADARTAKDSSYRSCSSSALASPSSSWAGKPARHGT